MRRRGICNRESRKMDSPMAREGRVQLAAERRIGGLEQRLDIAALVLGCVGRELDQWIVAFVVSKPGRSPSADEIKRFALANAPAYAHPRFVWFVDELPLASTNKVDRALLHGLAQERLAAAGA